MTVSNVTFSLGFLFLILFITYSTSVRRLASQGALHLSVASRLASLFETGNWDECQFHGLSADYNY